MNNTLRTLYPTDEALKRLLPRGDSANLEVPIDDKNKVILPGKIDLSEYGLECIGLLGYGGFSVCYHVRETKTGKDYACKISYLDRPSLNGSHWSSTTEKTLAEIKMMEQLSKREGILRLKKYTPSCSEIEKILTAYHEGKEKKVQHMLKKNYRILQITPLAVPYDKIMSQFYKQKLTIQQASALLWDIAKAISTVHSLSIVHRDVKPGNLYLIKGRDRPHVVISDFNISRQVLGSSPITFTPIGTQDYISPFLQARQLYGHAQMTPAEAMKLDTYALGAISYQIFNNGQMPVRIGHNTTPPKNAPLEICLLIVRMLETDVSKAMSMSDIIRTLEMIYKGFF